MDQRIIDKLHLKPITVKPPPGLMLVEFYLWPNGIKGCQTFLSEYDVQGNPLDNEVMWFVKQKPGDNFLIFVYPCNFIDDQEIFDHYVYVTKNIAHNYLGTPDPEGPGLPEKVIYLDKNDIPDDDDDDLPDYLDLYDAEPGG